MAAPGQVSVWVGLDVGKGEHFADVLDDPGERLFARVVGHDQAGLGALPDRAVEQLDPPRVRWELPATGIPRDTEPD